jgi:hypothetical protein
MKRTNVEANRIKARPTTGGGDAAASVGACVPDAPGLGVDLDERTQSVKLDAKRGR